ncbi:MAG: hypothetical protein Q4G47_03450 [Lachnospiraceae bacterium]|nr:hypothetical protein [Lachnospiraceae bacterium]
MSSPHECKMYTVSMGSGSEIKMLSVNSNMYSVPGLFAGWSGYMLITISGIQTMAHNIKTMKNVMKKYLLQGSIPGMIQVSHIPSILITIAEVYMEM